MSEADLKAVWAHAYDRLRSLKSSHRLRHDSPCEVADGAPDATRVMNGSRLLNFCSNDYLGLANHPSVKEGATNAIRKYGAGALASRLICGTLPVHRDLEQALANYKGTESALVFSSGYLACVGVLQALSIRSDDSKVPMIFDRLAHASLIDGATQDRRNWRSFPHNDTASLELLLQQVDVKEWPSAIVITEGVFSMDGDVAPVKAMSELCARYKAILLVDDAHGTGVMGERGKGVVGMAGLSAEPHVIQVGTLSKALGSQGGFVTGPAVLRDLLVNTARTFIFDTALNPGAAGAALAALQVIEAEPEHLKQLQENALLFRKLLNGMNNDIAHASPIIPVMLRGEELALKAAAELREQGIMVAAIRPPTVPPGTSRLRITLSAAHKEEDIRRLARLISQMQTA